MIRLYKETDKSCINTWCRECFHTDLIIGPFDVIYIYGDSKPKAFLSISIMYERAEINYLYVDIPYRKKRIALELLQNMLEILREKGVISITLEVSVQNVAAMKLYHKCGFKEIGIREKYYKGIDAYLMIKDVKA